MLQEQFLNMDGCGFVGWFRPVRFSGGLPLCMYATWQASDFYKTKCRYPVPTNTLNGDVSQAYCSSQLPKQDGKDVHPKSIVSLAASTSKLPERLLARNEPKWLILHCPSSAVAA